MTSGANRSTARQSTSPPERRCCHPEDAASTIFVLGRVAEWVAHIAAEYAEPAMRLRPRGEYVGP